MSGSLILLRGLPGSGKTTVANLLSESGKYPVFSVDDYFTDSVSGEYEFRFQENHLAYEACIRGVEEAMRNHAQKIFVHNTFTMDWEIEPYLEAAKAWGYSVHVLTVENRHGNQNLHGIPDDQIKKMAQKFRVVLC